MLEKISQHCARAAQRFNFLDNVRLASETLGVHRLAPVRNLTLNILRVADLAAVFAGNGARGATGGVGELIFLNIPSERERWQ
ncbi:MAG TPA: hypothetical protein VFR05_01140 [Terriglobia bacterium]|nr:hypothetical protein [Terriglobia bacterium]